MRAKGGIWDWRAGWEGNATISSLTPQSTRRTTTSCQLREDKSWRLGSRQHKLMQSLAEQRQACATPNDFIFAAAMREVEAGVGGRGVVGYDYDAGRAVRRFNAQRVEKQNLEDSVMMALGNATVADGTSVHDELPIYDVKHQRRRKYAVRVTDGYEHLGDMRQAKLRRGVDGTLLGRIIR